MTGWTLTFFANLDVFVLEQVCQKGKKKKRREEKNTGTFIHASTCLFFNSFYLFAFRNTEMWDVWALFQAQTPDWNNVSRWA